MSDHEDKKFNETLKWMLQTPPKHAQRDNASPRTVPRQWKKSLR